MIFSRIVKNVEIKCTKVDCKFYMDWDGTTIKEALDYYLNYNKIHYKNMTCVHNYQVTERRDG